VRPPPAAPARLPAAGPPAAELHSGYGSTAPCQLALPLAVTVAPPPGPPSPVTVTPSPLLVVTLAVLRVLHTQLGKSNGLSDALQ